MDNKIPKQILNSLLEINNDRVIIYSLVKNEIIYIDLKKALDACIQSSLLCSAQLVEEINRTDLYKNYKADPNQDFFNIWLVINEGLSVHKRGRISSLFNASENVFKSTYDNALNEQNIKHLSFRHRRLISKQKELLKTG